MPPVYLLADDLTGAADSGAQFARAGRRALLTLRPAPTPPADVHIFTSETRSLPTADQAAQEVSRLLRICPPESAALLYKKIDSTLRGHAAAELAALMAAAGERRALIAPAFPALQRVTRAGRVWAGGLPLEETPFAHEAAGGDLRLVFGAEACLLPLALVRGDEAALRAALRTSAGLVIGDAETEADLLRLARAALAEGVRVWCGSAGLAGALAGCLAPSTPPPPHPKPHAAGGRPILAVAGSRHPASRAQVNAAQQAGAAVVYLPPGGQSDAALEERWAAQLAAALRGGRPAVLTVGDASDVSCLSQTNLHSDVDYGYAQSLAGRSDAPDLPRPISPQAMAARLARITALVVTATRPGALFLTGGETARAVCAALGCTRLWLGGEVLPGLPFSRVDDGACAGLTLVTKAGGFGAPDALHQVFDLLRPSG